MFDFYPTCLEKTKHVGIFTPGCYFPHMFGFWHIGMGKGTHVWKKPHNYMFANVWHFPHMCGKSHWHAYFPLSYGCFSRIELKEKAKSLTCCRNAAGWKDPVVEPAQWPEQPDISALLLSKSPSLLVCSPTGTLTTFSTLVLLWNCMKIEKYHNLIM